MFRIRVALAVLVAAAVAQACTSTPTPKPTPRRGSPAPSRVDVVLPSVSSVISAFPPSPNAGEPGALAPGSEPSALPAPVLIADRDNNRLVVVDPNGRVVWQWPRPGDLAPGQTFRVPDDAFFTPDGKRIIVTQEDDFVVTEIDIASRKIAWRYGIPGAHGSTPGLLWNPDDAMMLADGNVILADIKNCRLIELQPGAGAPVWQLGRPGACRHAPPATFGSPNGAFALRDGHILVTEINGSWVDEIDLAGHVYWTAHLPAVAYPSDSNQYKPGEYVTADYSSPGQVVVFDSSGKVLWRWDSASGNDRLDHPSLAHGLANGDIVLNDDRNHRVVVIDPRADRIVWQYGHTGVPGKGPGYLDNPDGLDLVPPSSYADMAGLAK